jgi:single-stranded-DNA-specific exonuclease
MKIVERTFAEGDLRALKEAGVHPVLARIYAGRRIRCAGELKYEPAGLLAPRFMKSIHDAATLLADAIQAGQRMLIIADYDADGATACAGAVRGRGRVWGQGD